MYSAPLQRSAAAFPGSSSSPLGCSAVEFRSKEKSAGAEIAGLAEDAQRSDLALARLVAAQAPSQPDQEVGGRWRSSLGAAALSVSAALSTDASAGLRG